MASRLRDHGEPPNFAKWLIWLFRRDTWKQQPFIAVVATVIACAAVYSAYQLITSGETEDKTSLGLNGPIKLPDPAPKKVVVLMDSTLPRLVYDDDTQENGGTNADDITEILDDLGIKIIKETTSLAWQRDEQVLQLDPDLIIIHMSAFYAETNVRDTHRRLEMFLRNMAHCRAQFILYTRQVTLASQEAQDEWVRRFEARTTGLRRRLRLMVVPGGQSATFRNPDTARHLKLIVKETLKL